MLRPPSPCSETGHLIQATGRTRSKAHPVPLLAGIAALMAVTLAVGPVCAQGGGRAILEQALGKLYRARALAADLQVKTWQGGPAASGPGGGHATNTVKVAAIKPDLVRVDTDFGKERSLDLWDGKHYISFPAMTQGNMRYYSRQPLANSWGTFLSIYLGEIDAFFRPPAKVLGKLQVMYLRAEKVGGVDCHLVWLGRHPLASPSKHGPTHCYAEYAIGRADHLIRRVAVTYRPQQPGVQPPGPDRIITFSSIRLNAPLGRARFRFRPPAGAKPMPASTPGAPPVSAGGKPRSGR